EWSDAVAAKPVRDIEPLVSGRKLGDLPDSPRTPELERYRVTLELSPRAYALLRQARQLLKSERGGSVDDSELVRAMCTALLDGAEREQARHQIALTICESCKRG